MAKSSFWDDLGNALTRKAKGLSSKAENLYEIQKIRNKLSAQERMTEKLMMDIGKMIYTRYEHGEAVDGEVGAICEEISHAGGGSLPGCHCSPQGREVLSGLP